jgi:hypothetical protein
MYMYIYIYISHTSINRIYICIYHNLQNIPLNNGGSAVMTKTYAEPDAPPCNSLSISARPRRTTLLVSGASKKTLHSARVLCPALRRQAWSATSMHKTLILEGCTGAEAVQHTHSTKVYVALAHVAFGAAGRRYATRLYTERGRNGINWGSGSIRVNFLLVES